MTDNLANLQRFVAGHIAIADTKSPEAARSHLNARAEQLNDWLNALGTSNAPKHLDGLDAFMLSNARDRLAGEAERRGAA